MKERPIIERGEGIRAILEGRKTQTRRLIKPQPDKDGGWIGCVSVGDHNIAEFCSCGQAGDRLWVRETWESVLGFPRDQTRYRADGIEKYHKWHPSIHMPRWASRLTLEITEVRVERVQEITFEDCLAEGILSLPPELIAGFGLDWEPPDAKGKEPVDELADDLDSEIRHIFGKYWDSINGKGAWERNDWVWVLNFKRIEQATHE